MAQRSRTLVDKDQGLILSTSMMAHNHRQLHFQRIRCPFHVGTRYTSGAQTHKQAKDPYT